MATYEILMKMLIKDVSLEDSRLNPKGGILSFIAFSAIACKVDCTVGTYGVSHKYEPTAADR